MSKKFKGKTCVYCATATSTTADHVIGREFFLPNRRANLPVVPACESCNREKSYLEHYVMAILGFGGRHPDAFANLDTLVRKRILKNERLRAELAEGLDQNGGTAIPIKHEHLDKLFAMIAQGLLWYHWQALLGPGYSATAGVFASGGEEFFEYLLQSWQAEPTKRIENNLGEETFLYRGAQATESPQTTIWQFAFYGGVMFGGDPQRPGPASLVIAITGPDDIVQRLESGVFRTG
jgi:hypothetical protein